MLNNAASANLRAIGSGPYQFQIRIENSADDKTYFLQFESDGTLKVCRIEGSNVITIRTI